MNVFQRGSFPCAAVLQELLQCGSLPRVLSTGCSLSGTDYFSTGSPRGHKSCQKTCPSVGSSFHVVTGPARGLLQHGVSTGVTACCRHPPAPTWAPPQVFTMGCRGISGAWSTSSHSFFTDPVWWRSPASHQAIPEPANISFLLALQE